MVTSPCAQHLWDVNNDAEFLDDVKDDFFHSLTAKLIYIRNRTIPVIQPYGEFLTTKAAKSNVDDWKKLKICISYLNQTVENFSIIGVFNIKNLFTWFDASYAAYTNMYTQTRLLI